MSPPTPPRTRTVRRLRHLLTLAVTAAALVALLMAGREAGAYVVDFAAWVEGLGFWGPIVFAAGYIVATVMFVPGSLLTLAAGVLFGLGEGTLVVFVSATLGATVAFLISRHLARERVANTLGADRRVEAIDRAIEQEGGKIVFLLRLSPLFPFAVLNYVLGLTRVRFRDYVLASLGMLPGTFLYVYLGKGLGDLAALAGGSGVGTGAGGWLLLGVGLVATVAVTVIVTRAARRAIVEATHA